MLNRLDFNSLLTYFPTSPKTKKKNVYKVKCNDMNNHKIYKTRFQVVTSNSRLNMPDGAMIS